MAYARLKQRFDRNGQGQWSYRTGQTIAFSGNLPAENIGDLDLATCRDWAQHLERASGHIGWYRFHAGERSRALANLRQLVDGGWEGEAEWLEGYWAIQSLVDTPEFQAIVARQRAASGD